MSICTNESTTKIAKLNSRELKICKNLGQIRENIGVYSTWMGIDRLFKVVEWSAIKPLSQNKTIATKKCNKRWVSTHLLLRFLVDAPKCPSSIRLD